MEICILSWVWFFCRYLYNWLCFFAGLMINLMMSHDKIWCIVVVLFFDLFFYLLPVAPISAAIKVILQWILDGPFNCLKLIIHVFFFSHTQYLLNFNASELQIPTWLYLLILRYKDKRASCGNLFLWVEYDNNWGDSMLNWTLSLIFQYRTIVMRIIIQASTYFLKNRKYVPNGSSHGSVVIYHQLSLAYFIHQL